MAKQPSENPTGEQGSRSKRGGGPAPPPAISITLTPAFKLTFLTVLALTILSLGVSLGLVLWGKETEDTRRLIETCSTAYKLGFGAILGLLGGKAV